MTSDPPTFAVIAGGGTGGHVYPALAIANALVATGHHQSEIHFVGSKRTLEATVVPAAGYTITLLGGRGIKRKLSVDNVRAIVGLLRALARAIVLVRNRRPKVVVSVGGYAAAPAAIAAVLLRVPLVLAESNAVPGAVNRLVARFAAASAISWPHTPLPKATLTGNPVRPEIVAVDRSASGRALARTALGIPDAKLVVAAFGGSLGARSINKAMHDLAARWHDRGDVAIYHVVGRRDWDNPALTAVASEADPLWCKAVQYEEQMSALYAAADVLICRSGATTAAEVAVVAVPSVLVPLPHAPGDHQTENAKALERAGAAVLVPDEECTGEHLALVTGPLLIDEPRRQAMSAAARSLGMPDAAARVADLVEEHARS